MLFVQFRDNKNDVLVLAAIYFVKKTPQQIIENGQNFKITCLYFRCRAVHKWYVQRHRYKKVFMFFLILSVGMSCIVYCYLGHDETDLLVSDVTDFLVSDVTYLLVSDVTYLFF